MKCWLCKRKVKMVWEMCGWEKNHTETKLRDYCGECADLLIFDDCSFVIGVKARPKGRKVK